MMQSKGCLFYPVRPNQNFFQMIQKFLRAIALTLFALQISLQNADAFELFKPKNRAYLHIVGSSTISPFMATISEEFSRSQSLKNSPILTPLVEPNGTRAGIKLLCAGLGYEYPDFAAASRPIEKNEIENCLSNGVKEPLAIKIGYDGIVIGNFVSSKKTKLTKEQIFLALAQKVFDSKTQKLIANPYQKWSEIDASLPEVEILVYGPPLTSGTRDVFADLVMEDVCFSKPEFIAAYPDWLARRQQCHTLRSDGRFIASGENDSLIIQNLKNNHQAFGIFGFDFLVANSRVIQAVQIDDIEPSFASIDSKQYKLSRPLFVYFKKEHLELIPEMRGFIEEIISSETIGRKGYLLNSGLIALSDSELKVVQANILSQL
jgi:phosphate transport system substrate-binding protein